MEEEKKLLEATAVFLIRGNEVLLARKKRKIGKGRWNGYGGGVEPGESVREAAVRELFEESGGVRVAPHGIRKVARMDFHNTMSDGNIFVCRVHCFLADTWSGIPRETEEMGPPEWFSVDRLPFDEMLPAERDWLPLVFGGAKVTGMAYLGPFQKEKLRDTEVSFVGAFNEE